MPKMTRKDLEKYLKEHKASLGPGTGGFTIRGPKGSANIGRPQGNGWDMAQLQRAWGDATGVPKPR